MARGLILVGVFGAAHGVRGEVRLKSYTADPTSIGAFGALSDVTGKRVFEFLSLRPFRRELLVAGVCGVNDRDAAEALNGVNLFVPRRKLPPPGDDEFYHADLIGLRAETVDGDALGCVIGVHNFGAGDLLEIAAPCAEAQLLPFTKAVIPVVDVAGGRVLVVPPTAIDEKVAETVGA